jgi:exopolysaccharide biosynthesis protein
MKKLLLALFVLFIVTFTVSAQARIAFKRGARSAIVSGTLNSYKSKKTFVIRVRAGQVLKTEQLGRSRPITIEVIDPSGEIAADSDASCNNRKQTEETVRGDYKIIVTECMKADAWRGTFKFRIWVE